MKFVVDMNLCDGHAQCTYLAPKIFEVDDDGVLTLRALAVGSEYESPELDQDLVEGVRDAANMCPVNAIRLVD
ncbi:hypothetical protein GCM10009836_70440 [Pseudonocardia ailaonensis]|uniref:Ferredoxin n=1 Tax=Pseudonocardia ailaonensis TaxID=367279 RepID=A0ABN2NNY1_9PSEU